MSIVKARYKENETPNIEKADLEYFSCLNFKLSKYHHCEVAYYQVSLLL